MTLPPLCEAFVLHFGEMGSRWGINRTVGQIYAVLFIAERPLCADDIVERLGISRSNVSMGIKELQSWNLLRQRSIPVTGANSSTRPRISTPSSARWWMSARSARSTPPCPCCANS